MSTEASLVAVAFRIEECRQVYLLGGGIAVMLCYVVSVHFAYEFIFYLFNTFSIESFGQ